MKSSESKTPLVSGDQRCNSKTLKTLDGPLKKPQNTPGQISMRLAYILEKIQLFQEKI